MTTTLPTKLSARELDIMACLEEGLGTDAIATQLRIKHHTVRNHIAHIMVKLGASSRMEIVAIARGNAGSIPQPEPVRSDQRAVTVLRFLIERGIPITDTEAAAITKAFT
jgi:DNA-binding CsgD family transcriptional regulator